MSMEGRVLDCSGRGHTKVAVSHKFGNKLPDSIKYGIFVLRSCERNKFSKSIRYFGIQRMQSYMPFENFNWKQLCFILDERACTNSSIRMKSIRFERYEIFDVGSF